MLDDQEQIDAALADLELPLKQSCA
jgi:hypothetical protein